MRIQYHPTISVCKLIPSYKNHIDLKCDIDIFRYAGRIWSSWMTVIITAERYITIAWPLKVGHISTPLKAKAVIFFEMLASFLIAAFVWFTTGVYVYRNENRCLITKPKEYQYLSIAIMGFGELLMPSIIVWIVTGLIIRKLMQAGQRRRQQREGQTRTTSHAAQERQLTYTLLAVAITFVVVRLPYVITFYLNNYKVDQLIS